MKKEDVIKEHYSKMGAKGGRIIRMGVSHLSCYTCNVYKSFAKR